MKHDYGNMQGWIKGMPRFWIERRTGQIAVIDSKEADIPINDFNSATKGVVWFRMGKEIPFHRCPICHQSCGALWEVPQQLVEEAIVKADEMNDKFLTNTPQTQGR